MNFNVCLDANLIKRLKTLRRAGGRAARAAGHAEIIMNEMMAGDVCSLKLLGRLTRHGEARIRNCIKYDLVDGYRLVAIRRGCDFVFAHVGTHDNCDRWIRNNVGIEPVTDKRRNEIHRVETGPPDAAETEGEADPFEDDYDRLLMQNIDEKDLRKIFSGLCGAHKEKSV